MPKYHYYYFDIETTGTDPQKHQIITIQWWKLNATTEKPEGELTILKSWGSSEKDIIETFIKSFLNLKREQFNYIFVGVNLIFDFYFLGERMRYYGLKSFINLSWLRSHPIIDIKPLLVLMNKGQFKGYDKLIPSKSPYTGSDIPRLFNERRYDEIIQYIKDEAENFVKIYGILKEKLPSLYEQIKELLHENRATDCRRREDQDNFRAV